MKDRKGRAVTIAEVATDAGVSIPTVSRVLNGSAPVAQPTRHRVLNSIKRLGYHPNPMARGLSRGRSDTVMVILPHIAEPSIMLRLQGLVSVLRESPYELHLVDIEHPVPGRRSLLDIVGQNRPAAAVIISLPPSASEARRFAESATPVVLVDVESGRLPADAIDDVAGGELATRHLLALGHRRIAFVGDDDESMIGVPASADRRRGFEQAMAAAGVTVPRRHVRTVAREPEAAAQVGAELFASADPPTAVFAAYDVLAFALIRAARDAGLDVPRDVSVIGFDDIQAASLAGLTTVRQPLEVTGRRAGLRVLHALGHSTDVPLPDLPPLELVERSTTASPPPESSPVPAGDSEVASAFEAAGPPPGRIPRRK